MTAFSLHFFRQVPLLFPTTNRPLSYVILSYLHHSLFVLLRGIIPLGTDDTN